MSAPVLTLRMDATGTAFGTAPTWTTYTSSLMADSFTTSWGSADEHSEPSPRTASFELSNASGAWTPGHASAPAGWDVGARVNVRLLANAVTTDRFDGYVDSIEPTWPGGVQSWSVVRVSCTDITARLAIGQPLRSMLGQEMLADSPSFFYPFTEDSTSATAGNVSATMHAAATRLDGQYGVGTIAFGGDDGVTFGPASTPGVTGAASVMSIPTALGSGDHAHECWFTGPSAAPANEMMMVCATTDPASGEWVAARQYAEMTITTGGFLQYAVTHPFSGSSEEICTSAVSVCDGLEHHAVGVVDGSTLRLYLDGVEVATDTNILLGGHGFTVTHVGGRVINGATGAQFVGTIRDVAAYNTALSAARVLARYQAAKGTLTERSDLRYARLADYANVTTSGLPVGHAEMGAQDLVGKTIVEALAMVARTEGTVSFATGAGELTFHARTARYNAAVGLTLTGDDISPDTAIRRDRQGFANEVTVTREGGAAQRVVDVASQTAKGRFSDSLEVACSTDNDALQNAAWQVAIRKQPRTRLSSITVNLLAQPTAATVASVLAATVGTLLEVTGLPSQAPATSMQVFIEGATETIGVSQWSITFATSPNLPYVTLRADAVPSARTELDAGLKIPF